MAFTQAPDTPITYNNFEALVLSAKGRIHKQSHPSLDAALAAFHVTRPCGSTHGFPLSFCGGVRCRSFLSGRGSSHNSFASESILRLKPVRAAVPPPSSYS